ncbi:response regulator transcription factor [Pontibacter sp. 172403-2]|uniref:LytR/AlgR family response regulator transcription factor n=1 Tax=Pontibacter rufus TaxID=2791028 RepID=UPI0018AFB447|nr:LytTR family DNA-binding domain-containing protein [Pontibacter sp. 172403-2]MBF9255623.1 response regulator transcription factor [Pontibacter sp. 172403-2]
MGLTAIIIDDEQNNIDNLFELLGKYCPEIDVLAIASSADVGIELIRQTAPELVFLDIQMPGKSGFDVLKAIDNYNFEVIFVTAYDQYGIKAIKFAAIDYILKPVDVEELQTAVKKAIIKRQEKRQNHQLENLLQLLQQRPTDTPRIALPLAKETRFVKVDEIIRCESSNNYTTFYFIGGEKVIVSKPIYEYEEILDNYHFIRCHQSHLVNKKFIKSWIKDDGDFLLLEDKVHVPVSRQKREFVKSLLLK